LIVDDELGLAEALCDLLTHFGYRTEKAWNGQLALKMAAERKLDLIITDIMMPIMDGYELLTALKANPEWRDIPVVLMSAVALKGPETRPEIAAFLAKPFEIAPFVDLVRQLIG
jgi:CheY-like chemotaxis protein